LSDARSNLKQSGTPFAGPSTKPWLVKGPSGDIAGVITTVAQTTTIFFRHQFGERYLNPSSLLKGMVCFVLYLSAMRLYAVGGKHSIEIPVPIIGWLTWLGFATAFLLFASFHMFVAVNRRQMLRDEFSYSSGKPLGLWMKLPLLSDEWDFERFYEPAIILAAGVALTLVRNWFGPYLILSGACAFHVARKKHHLRRELELNVLDSRAEAANVPRFEGGAQGTSAKPVVGMPPVSRSGNQPRVEESQ